MKTWVSKRTLEEIYIGAGMALREELMDMVYRQASIIPRDSMWVWSNG